MALQQQSALQATAATSAALYDDALASIFRFLPMHDLATVFRVCLAWRSFVRERMTSAGFVLDLCVPVTSRVLQPELSEVAQSPLARHIMQPDTVRIRR